MYLTSHSFYFSMCNLMLKVPNPYSNFYLLPTSCQISVLNMFVNVIIWEYFKLLYVEGCHSVLEDSEIRLHNQLSY